jgi:hypothetical protein
MQKVKYIKAREKKVKVSILKLIYEKIKNGKKFRTQKGAE